VTRRRQRAGGPLQAFVEQLHKKKASVHRTPGTAVFLTRGKTTPLAMRANVEHNHVLHEHVLILSIETLPVPYVSADDRIVVDELGYEDDGIVRATARFGYMQRTNVPDVLRRAARESDEFAFDADETTYFLSTVELAIGNRPGLATWRKRLFLATAGVSADAAEAFHLPREQTLTVGSRIEV
jgi:KUP system potassium uptake protein